MQTPVVGAKSDWRGQVDASGAQDWLTRHVSAGARLFTSPRLRARCRASINHKRKQYVDGEVYQWRDHRGYQGIYHWWSSSTCSGT